MKILLLIVLSTLFTACASQKIVVQNCDQTKSNSDWVCEQSIWSWK